MVAKLITYDLNSPGHDYKKLHEVIKSLGAWRHDLESVWLVDTHLTCEQISAKIRSSTDKNDYLLVIDVTADSRDGWLPKDAWEWMRQHMDRR